MLKQPKSNVRRKGKKHTASATSTASSAAPSTASSSLSPSPSNLPPPALGEELLAPAAYPFSFGQREENKSNDSAVSVLTSEAESALGEPMPIPTATWSAWGTDGRGVFEHEHEHQHGDGYERGYEEHAVDPASADMGFDVGEVAVGEALIDFAEDASSGPVAGGEEEGRIAPFYESCHQQPQAQTRASPKPIIAISSTSTEATSPPLTAPASPVSYPSEVPPESTIISDVTSDALDALSNVPTQKGKKNRTKGKGKSSASIAISLDLPETEGSIPQYDRRSYREAYSQQEQTKRLPPNSSSSSSPSWPLAERQEDQPDGSDSMDAQPTPTPAPASLRLWDTAARGVDRDTEVLVGNSDGNTTTIRRKPMRMKEKVLQDQDHAFDSPAPPARIRRVTASSPPPSRSPPPMVVSKQRTIKSRASNSSSHPQPLVNTHIHPSTHPNPPSLPSPAILSIPTSVPVPAFVEDGVRGGRGYTSVDYDDYNDYSDDEQRRLQQRQEEARGGQLARQTRQHPPERPSPPHPRQHPHSHNHALAHAPSSPQPNAPYHHEHHSRSTSLGGYASPSTYPDSHAISISNTSHTSSSVAGHGRLGAGGMSVGDVVGRVGGLISKGVKGVSGISASKSLGSGYPLGGNAETRGAGSDVVLWSRWDVMKPGDRRILIIGYARGLQIWDCTDLGMVRELLNVNFDGARGVDFAPDGGDLDLGRVVYAGALPPPSLVTAGDGGVGAVRDLYESERPIIGVITSAEDDHTVFVVYSLVRQRVLKKIVFPGLVKFEANEFVIVLSTINPPTLHILSSASFEVLSIIPHTALIPFARKVSMYQQATPTPTSIATSPSIYPRIAMPTTSTTNTYTANTYTANANANATSFGPVLSSHPERGDEHIQGVSSVVEGAFGGFEGGSGNRVREVKQPVFTLSGRLLAFGSSAPPPQRAGDARQVVTAKTSRTRSPGSNGSSPRQKVGTIFSGGVVGGMNSGSAAVSPATDTNLPSTTTLSQASELGQAALLKVGGTMLSGMKTLGGMAYSAAKAKAGEQFGIGSGDPRYSHGRPGVGNGSGSGTGNQGLGGTMGSLASRFFSRSAPAASGGGGGGSEDGAGRGRRYSTASSTSAGSEGPESGVGRDSTVAPMTRAGAAEKGYYITVVDIKPLLSVSTTSTTTLSAHTSTFSSTTAPLTILSEFLASRHQPISDIRFSSDGTSILVSPKDGQTLQIFKIRPKSLAIRRLSGKIARTADISPDTRGSPQPTSSPPQQRRARASLQMTAATSPSTSRNPSMSRREASAVLAQDPPFHVYDLRRGRTSAVVEEIDWADDERWVAIGTKKRTIHLFPVNPYGGKPDVNSHMEGVVRNSEELQPLSVEVHPIVRLRAQKQPNTDQFQAPLVFTLFRSTSQTLPSHLLPPPVFSPRASHPVGSLGSTPDSEAISPRHTERPRNFQDILVFDPTDSVLSLRRVHLELKTADEGISLRGLPASVPGIGSTSISLPGMGGAGRLGSSPSSGSNAISNAQPTWGRSAAPPSAPKDLSGKELVAATWDLRRHPGRPEVRRPISGSVNVVSRKQSSGSKTDWLSQAELSTYSQSTRVLPRSIYLSHQFTFRTLGEDYHALIRQFHFDTTGSKIEVRKQVEASAFSAGTGESFVEGFAPHRDPRRASSSFDEPLASALGAGLDSTRAPPVLPMLPNGLPSSGPASIRNAIPIRTISGNMTEGIGRIRNQFQQRVRSPRSGAIGSGATPLEFDEELEDASARDGLLDNGIIIRGVSRRGATGTDSPSAHEDADDLWRTWESQDRLAVEEAERFDDISVVGLLDEEQASLNQKMKERGRKHGR